jgi:chromosome segregation protein
LQTFDALKNNFSKIFTKIADKMQGSIFLEKPQSPFDGGVEVKIVKEKGREVPLAALSGGEKVLVALALIFAIQEHQPAPFYLLDEVDAALDSVNSEKVAKLLKEYSSKAQVVVVSHNDAIISAAEQIYGVWRNKEGESYVNSLKI